MKKEFHNFLFAYPPYSRLLFPKKGNNQLSPTAESMHLQFPQDWPGNSYNKEDVPGFQSFPDRTFDLNEYEPNGSYVGDDLHQFSLSNDQLQFPAPSINKSPPLLKELTRGGVFNLLYHPVFKYSSN